MAAKTRGDHKPTGSGRLATRPGSANVLLLRKTDMTLDLEDLTAGWTAAPGEISARVVVGRDGEELIQLRVELGVMQMWPAGRPDGSRYREQETVCLYIQRELREGRAVAVEHWRELERELLQTNYRRLALASLAEQALASGDAPRARSYILLGLRDIDNCLRGLDLLNRAAPAQTGPLGLRPTLVFNRGRLITQLRVLEGHYDEAIEQAKLGAAALHELLIDQGIDPELAADDPGVRLLYELSESLRREYGISLTLEEQLQQAVETDDFETAARLRDELRRRNRQPHRQAGGEAA